MTLRERKQLIIDALQQVEVARAGDPTHITYEIDSEHKPVCHCKHCKTYEELTKQLVDVNSKLKHKRKMKRYEHLEKEMAGMNKSEQAHYLQLERVDRDDIINHFGISGAIISENTPDVIREERKEDERKIFDAWMRGVVANDEGVRKLELNKEINASSLAWRFKTFDKKYGGVKKMNRKLVEQGYKEGLTPAEISEKHGIEYQTVYYHYKNIEKESNTVAESKPMVESKPAESKPAPAPTKPKPTPKPTESNDTLSRVLEHFGDVIQQAANDKIAAYAKENNYEAVRSVADLMVQLQK